jgi:hypothetical protein
MRIARKLNKEAARKRVIKKQRDQEVRDQAGDEHITEASVCSSSFWEEEHMRDRQDGGILHDLPNRIFETDGFHLFNHFMSSETFHPEKFNGSRSLQICNDGPIFAN